MGHQLFILSCDPRWDLGRMSKPFYPFLKQCVPCPFNEWDVWLKHAVPKYKELEDAYFKRLTAHPEGSSVYFLVRPGCVIFPLCGDVNRHI